MSNQVINIELTCQCGNKLEIFSIDTDNFGINISIESCNDCKGASYEEGYIAGCEETREEMEES